MKYVCPVFNDCLWGIEMDEDKHCWRLTFDTGGGAPLQIKNFATPEAATESIVHGKTSYTPWDDLPAEHRRVPSIDDWPYLD